MKKIVSILLLLLAVKSYAQVQQPKLNNSMIPPSPDAASLGKYGAFPVTLYTGSPNISIPITEVKTSKLSVPVSLSYNYNGYRVSEEASSIGMGWALQAGGVITRMVRGRTDDQQIPTLDYKWYDVPYLTDLMDNPDYLDKLKLYQADPEPDIYTFSFSGYSGKFILIDHRAFLFPKQDLVITENGGGFLINTPDGAIYTFQAAETTTSYIGNNQNALPPYTSSWHLTNVRSEQSSEQIQFTYTTREHIQPVGGWSDVLTKKVGTPECNPMPCFTMTPSSSSGGRIAIKEIATISSSNMLVKFIRNTIARKDLNYNNTNSNNTPYSIKSIEIYSKPNNELIKKITLDQDYFGDNINPNISNCHLKLKSVQVTGYRYKKENGQTVTESLQEPPHVFSYMNEQASYPKSGRGIDRWGYFNGANNLTLFGSDIPENFPTIPVGDREVHVDYMKSGILEKIAYPTGGYSTFEYENNVIRLPQYGDYIPVTQFTSKTTINPSSTLPTSPQPSTSSNGFFTITTQQNITVNYGRGLFPEQPNPLGTEIVFKLYMIPLGQNWDDPNPTITQIPVNTSLAQGSPNDNTTPPIALNPGNYKYVVTCLWNWQKAYANFNYVTMEPYLGSPGPGMRISSIKSFDNTDATNPKLVKNYTYGNGAKLINLPNFYESNTVNYNGACDNYSITTYNSEYSSSLYSLVNEQFYYPTVTEVNADVLQNGKTVYQYNGNTDIFGVNLIAQTDYKAISGTNFQKVKEVTNVYGDPFSGTKTIHFWGLKHRLIEAKSPTSCIYWSPFLIYQTQPNVDIQHRTELYTTESYALWSEPRLLLSTAEKVYDESQTNPNTTNTTYLYEAPAHLNATKIIVNNSKGETITTQIKYPLDYTILGCPSLQSIDNTFRDQTRPTYSQNYQTARNIRYYGTSGNNGAYNLIYPTPGYYNNPTNNTLIAYMQANPSEANYKSNYASALSFIGNSGVTAYSCFDPTNYPNSNGAIINMQRFNNQTPIEKIVSITKNGSTYLQGATKTDYSLFNNSGNFWTQPKTIYTTEVQPSTVLLSNFNNTYYKPKIDFKFNNTSLIEQSKTNDVKMAYVWDYDNNYAIAEVANAATEDIAATSFESIGTGGFSFTGTPVDDGTPTITGTKYYTLGAGAEITKTGLTASKTYTVSYWGQVAKLVNGAGPTITGRTLNGYTYYEHQITNTTSLSITGGGKIDELRLYPSGALMTTYTYQPLVGVTTKCDANNRISYYSYDALARLQYIKDQDNNIIKKLCYSYAGQPENCITSVNYYNAQLSQVFTKNNCASVCDIGSQVTYTVPASTYSSTVSQAAADQLAQNDINANGQQYANTNGTCTPPANGANVPITYYNTVGFTGFTVTYTGGGNTYTFNLPTGTGTLGCIPSGVYTVTISKPANTTNVTFNIGCATFSGTSATFKFRNVSSSSCNVVNLDL
jgi:Family of unknown function (DUF5977)